MFDSLFHSWRTSPDVSRRVVLFGSSNTELAPHNLGYYCWGDYVSIALRQHVGKHVLVTNAGISGETVTDLLARYDRDLTPLRPHLVLITIGGNDQWRMPVSDYHRQLSELVTRLKSDNILPVLHTYYSVYHEDSRLPVLTFADYMSAKRDIARDQAVPCIDSYPRLLALHQRNPNLYHQLMLDPGHLNPTGHALFGTLATRTLGFPDTPAASTLQPLLSEALSAM